MTATLPAAAATATGCPRATVVHGADLHEGSIVVQELPDGSVETHRIDHFREYPGRYGGTVHRDPQHPRRISRATVDAGHARVAYDAAEAWRHTYADGEIVHVLTEEES